ncbi:MAG TPA: hypothetical protein VEZ90_04360 [Blastocatellia bacterium]|nr:hypothetical protein [Blastocatellia bacterium]
MPKPPEEGLIWEWRAFGRLPLDLKARVDALPVRAGIQDVHDLDIYLISPRNNQNVKLRRLGARWVLKLKQLLETLSSGIDLYREGMNMIYELPVSLERVEEAAVLLETDISNPTTPSHRVDRAELVQLFRAASPPVCVVEAPKVRSQFLIEKGWVELADVEFPKRRIQTISVHSHDRAVVEETLSNLDCTDSIAPNCLEAMNYVEACRRWA